MSTPDLLAELVRLDPGAALAPDPDRPGPAKWFRSNPPEDLPVALEQFLGSGGEVAVGADSFDLGGECVDDELVDVFASHSSNSFCAIGEIVGPMFEVCRQAWSRFGAVAWRERWRVAER